MPLPDQPNLEYLKNEAKNLLKAARLPDAQALAVLQEHHPRYDALGSRFSLQDCQLALARRYGYDSWPKLSTAVGLVHFKERLDRAIRDNDAEALQDIVRLEPALLQALLEEKSGERYTNWFSGAGATLLQLAAFARRDLGLALAQAGAPLDLHTACALGKTEKVAEHIGNGAPLDQQIDSYTPMQYTLRHLAAPGNLDVLRLLLENGDDANRPLQKLAWFEWEDQAAEQGLSDWRPIHALALTGSRETSVEGAVLLKAHGADLNAVARPFGETALHLAAIYNGDRLIHWLVANGVPVDGGTLETDLGEARADLFDQAPFAPFDTHGKTALMLALGEGQQNAAAALVETGASLAATDAGGFTPLHYAAGAFWEDNAGLVQWTIERGGRPQARDIQGRTPLDLARARNYAASVAVLEANA